MSAETWALRDALASGQLGLQDYLQELLRTLRVRDAELGAFVSIEEEQVQQLAEGLDRARRLGHALGPLFGLPVGVKDIIDVAGFTTGYGLPAGAGSYPLHDSTLARRLRASGALILGKTVSTPLASRAPSKTRHPLNPSRGPGGSSSGSAAAVAAGFVPLAIGTQTNGSVIRPAAFCGVPAFKPTYGLIPRTGVLIQSTTLDQIGLFARDLEGLARLTECLMGEDGQDDASRGAPRLGLCAGLDESWTRPPRFALVLPPAIGQPSAVMQSALDELLEFLGVSVEPVQYDYLVEDCLEAHRVIHAAELAHHYKALHRRHPEAFPQPVLDQMQLGREISAVRYLQALDLRERSQSAFDDTFSDFDVILTLSALDVAPESPDTTGDPSPCTPWSLLGFPALHVPLFVSPDGMPMGVQLVGAPWQDQRVLRVGKWLKAACSESNG